MPKFIFGYMYLPGSRPIRIQGARLSLSAAPEETNGSANETKAMGRVPPCPLVLEFLYFKQEESCLTWRSETYLRKKILTESLLLGGYMPREGDQTYIADIQQNLFISF